MKKTTKLLLVIIAILSVTATTAFAGTYIVKEGDVLWKIAEEHDTDWKELAKENDLVDPNLITVGQELKVPDSGGTESLELFDESFANAEEKLSSAWTTIGNVDFYTEYMELYRPEGDTLGRRVIREFSEDAKGLITVEYDFASSGTDDGVGNAQFLLRGKNAEGKGGNVIVAIRHSADEVRIQNGGGAGDADTYDLLSKVAFGDKHTIKMVIDTDNDTVQASIDGGELKEYPMVAKDVDIDSLADAYWILYQKGEEKHNGAGFGVGLRMYGMRASTVKVIASDEEIIQDDLDDILISHRWGLKNDFTLPLKGANGTAFSWNSSNTAAMTIDSKTGTVSVNRTDSHQVAKLTVTGTLNNGSVTKDIEVTVLANSKNEPLAGEKDFVYLDAGRLNIAKKEIQADNALYTEAYDTLILNANKELDKNVDPVTNKTIMPPSGDIHDYYSIAPYSWPNPDTKDGLPWINKDGQVNPLTRGADTDQTRLSNMFKSLDKLTLAYYFSNDEKYINKAKEIVKIWFIDEETKVNPNINFGQGVPGQVDGRMFGIIEWTDIGKVVTTVQMLEKDNLITDAELATMKNWFDEYLIWLTTSELGIGESTRLNNHASNYDYQVAGLMIYLGKMDEATAVVEEAKTKRVATQIEEDGSQPHELARTKSVNYTVNNLWALARLADLGRRFTDVDLWSYETEEGVSLNTGFDFAIPYLIGDKKWTWEQITGGGADKQLKNMLLPMYSRTEWMLREKILPLNLNGYGSFDYRDILVYVPLDKEPLKPITVKVSGELQTFEKGVKKVAGVIVVDAEEFIGIMGKKMAVSAEMKKQITAMSNDGKVLLKDASEVVGTVFNWDDNSRAATLKTKEDEAESVQALKGNKINILSVEGRLEQEDHPQEYATDSDLTTVYTLNGNEGEIVILELDGTYTVGGVAIAYSRGSKRTASFDVEVSMDKVNWTKVTSGISSGKTEELEGYIFEEVKAKYVKIIGFGNSSSSWNSFREIQVYGIEGR